MANLRKLLMQARDEFARLDMPGPLASANRFERTVDDATSGAGPLTAREFEVAELVSGGLSNRDIAGRLYLSERTVESHVRSALAKVGARTRVELATWMIGNKSS